MRQENQNREKVAFEIFDKYRGNQGIGPFYNSEKHIYFKKDNRRIHK